MFAIGAMLNNLERDRIKAWSVAQEMGFEVVHTSALPECWLSGPELAHYIGAARTIGLTIHSMFIGFDGQSYATPASAARTVGLAVAERRADRLRMALAYPEVAEQLGAGSLSTHIGQLPPPATADYVELLATTRQLADACAARQQTLHLETGQEAATVLLRFLIDLERGNVGVNFDAGNFILYGSDDPTVAVEVLGPWVRGVHCKDALPAGEPGQLGTDVPLGQGVVPWPHLVERLVAHGYRGPWIIEREHGPRVHDDFVHGRAYLEKLLLGAIVG